MIMQACGYILTKCHLILGTYCSCLIIKILKTRYYGLLCRLHNTALCSSFVIMGVLRKAEVAYISHATGV